MSVIYKVTSFSRMNFMYTHNVGMPILHQCPLPSINVLSFPLAPQDCLGGKKFPFSFFIYFLDTLCDKNATISYQQYHLISYHNTVFPSGHSRILVSSCFPDLIRPFHSCNLPIKNQFSCSLCVLPLGIRFFHIMFLYMLYMS